MPERRSRRRRPTGLWARSAWQRPQPPSGGPAYVLPLVVTEPASSIVATAATIVGMVNPEGNSTSWYFAWGTTSALGNVTATQSAGSGSQFVVASSRLTGLTQGHTYFYALVGKTATSTVYGTTLTFVPQPAAPPAFPYGAPSVTIPHLQCPFKLTNLGADVVQQNTLEEVFSCVQAVVRCPAGACPDLGTFGIPQPTFAQEPIDTGAITDAIQEWEPRATESVVSQLASDKTSWKIALTTSYVGDQSTS